jgi:hypothetical protein
MIKNVYWPHVEYSLFFRILMKNFLLQFSKDIKISNFLTAHPEESSCCMRKDRQIGGQTDIAQITVAFRNFANAPKNCSEN